MPTLDQKFSDLPLFPATPQGLAPPLPMLFTNPACWPLCAWGARQLPCMRTARIPHPCCAPAPPTLRRGRGHPLTLLLGRRHRAPAFASRAVAGLLGGVVLQLQVLWWGGRGSGVLPGGLMDFGDLLSEARGSDHLCRPSVSHRDRGKPSRPPAREKPESRGGEVLKGLREQEGGSLHRVGAGAAQPATECGSPGPGPQSPRLWETGTGKQDGRPPRQPAARPGPPCAPYSESPVATRGKLGRTSSERSGLGGGWAVAM